MTAAMYLLRNLQSPYSGEQPVASAPRTNAASVGTSPCGTPPPPPAQEARRRGGASRRMLEAQEAELRRRAAALSIRVSPYFKGAKKQQPDA